jgi:hypothetical protein
MLPFGVTIQASVSQRSEFPEGLMNYPVKCTYVTSFIINITVQKIAGPLQAWSGPGDSRQLRFPGILTKAQYGDKIVSLTHRPPYTQEIFLVVISVRG